jgi:hypothetical protein
MALRRRRVITRRPRRKTVWARFSNFTATLAGGSTSVLSPLAETETELGGNDLFGATLIRVRGELTATLTAAATADTFADFAYGLIVMPSEVGYSSTRSILVEGRWDDWMAYGGGMLYTNVAGTGAIPAVSGARWPIDVRSRRKLDEIGTLVSLVFSNRTAGATVRFGGNLSFLLALPSGVAHLAASAPGPQACGRKWPPVS